MKKLTKTNFKTFIKKNAGKMFIMTRSSFSGMTDGIEFEGRPEFKPLKILLNSSDNTYGLDGVWLVGSSRDYFEVYEKDAQGYEGISVSNCCGHFIIAIKKEEERKITKFEIKVETRQVWRAQIEAETLEDARKIRDNFYQHIQEEIIPEIEENIKATYEPVFRCIETFGGDDLSDLDIKTLQDLTQLKTTKAFRSDAGGEFCDTAFCPECEAENTGDIYLAGAGKWSCDFDTDEANAKIFECRCFNCGKLFRVDYFKEV